MLRSPTGHSVGYDERVKSPTRTTADLVAQAGFLRTQTKILVTDSNEVHQSAQDLHITSLLDLHRKTSDQHEKENLPRLLNKLSSLGFSWRDIARVSGVSVLAVRKWCNGGFAAARNRKRVAEIVALCEIVREQYLIDDAAGWLETQLCPEAPVTALDLVAAQRFALVLQLASNWSADPENVLDEFDPEWRQRYASTVKVFTAPDGLPGVRLAEGRS